MLFFVIKQITRQNISITKWYYFSFEGSLYTVCHTRDSAVSDDIMVGFFLPHFSFHFGYS